MARNIAGLAQVGVVVVERGVAAHEWTGRRGAFEDSAWYAGETVERSGACAVGAGEVALEAGRVHQVEA